MKIESIYKHFLVTQTSHLPIINEEGEVLGLVSKQKLMMEMADVSLSGVEYEVIPETFLDNEITESILFYFTHHSTIPVLNQKAQKVDIWDKPRFLAEFSRIKTIPKETVKESQKPKEEMNASKTAIFQFMSSILSNFPDALFATDKEGVTTFYNEKFETSILTKSMFRDSISIAEKYFKELNQDLFGNYLKNHDIKKNFPVLLAFVKNLNSMVRIITLKEGELVTGFLYQFMESSSIVNKMNEKGYVFPDIEEAFAMNYPLEALLNDVESRYIYYRLLQNEDNISHTADILKIPRSTLQNKIKQLKIYQRFAEKKNSPIPRNSKKNVEKKTKAKEKVNKVQKKDFKSNKSSKTEPSKQIKKNTKFPKKNFKGKGKNKPKNFKKK
jgi:transcriptional regulator with PAS, ATPase and Fis domain